VDADKIITLVEKYLRDFVVYLLSFFTHKAAADTPSTPLDDLNSSLVFSVISTVLGAFLWDRYILSLSGSQKDVVGLVTDSLLMWASLGIALYVLFRLLSLRLNPLSPVLAVVKIFAVSHVVAIYAAYLTICVCQVFMTPSQYGVIAQRGAFLGAYAIELVLIWCYLPGEVRAIAPPVGPWRLRAIIFVFLVLVTFVVAVRAAGFLYDASHAAVQAAAKQGEHR
jgi:hypothetical protein